VATTSRLHASHTKTTSPALCRTEPAALFAAWPWTGYMASLKSHIGEQLKPAGAKHVCYKWESRSNGFKATTGDLSYPSTRIL
jgi:hypothetical protein